MHSRVRKTCFFLGRVTSQWRYERREELKEEGERSEKSKREEKAAEQTGKVGRGRNRKRSRGKVIGGSASGSLRVREILYMYVYIRGSDL